MTFSNTSRNLFASKSTFVPSLHKILSTSAPGFLSDLSLFPIFSEHRRSLHKNMWFCFCRVLLGFRVVESHTWAVNLFIHTPCYISYSLCLSLLHLYCLRTSFVPTQVRTLPLLFSPLRGHTVLTCAAETCGLLIILKTSPWRQEQSESKAWLESLGILKTLSLFMFLNNVPLLTNPSLNPPCLSLHYPCVMKQLSATVLIQNPCLRNLFFLPIRLK